MQPLQPRSLPLLTSPPLLRPREPFPLLPARLPLREQRLRPGLDSVQEREGILAFLPEDVQVLLMGTVGYTAPAIGMITVTPGSLSARLRPQATGCAPSPKNSL